MSLSLVSAVSAALVSVQQVPNRETVDQGLIIEWHHKHVQSNPRIVSFTGGVRAFYGPSIMDADSLTLYLDEGEKRGVAEGHVVVTDPDGTIHADRTTFNWAAGTGSADTVDLHSGRFKVAAKSVAFTPTAWTLNDIAATPCHEDPPVISIKARSAKVEPGKRVTLDRPQLSILGVKLFTLPKYTTSLDRKRPGLKMPVPSYRAGRGFGFSWNSGFAFDDQTAFSFGLRVFPKQASSGSVELSRSLIPASEGKGGIVPRSDFDEPMSYGYFDNVFVKSPAVENSYISSRRTNVSVSTAWNVGQAARKSDTLFTKPWDIVVEDGRNIGTFGLATSVRAQSIREEAGPTESRFVGTASVIPPFLDLAPGLYLSLRGDAEGFFNKGPDSGWVRGQVGLVYRPNDTYRFGLAYASATPLGTPRFLADELYALRTVHARFDINLGPTKLGILGKYDLDAKRWYDTEVAIDQIAGCFEPFVVYRRFPNTFGFGLRLRLDDLLEKIARRTGKGVPIVDKSKR